MNSVIKKLVLILCVIVIFLPDVHAQDRIRTISLKGLYTSSSRLFPSPNAADEIERNRYSSLDHIFGYGADIRYGIPELGLVLGMTVEYLRKTGDFFTHFEMNDGIVSVPTIDGYHIIPVELTGYFLIPVGGERFQFYIGGGAGLYLGRRTYEIGDAASESLEQSVYPGIHVVSGIDYYVYRHIGIRAEMKFRDPDIETRNRFTRDSIIYNSHTIYLPDGDIPSRINVDGIAFSLALVLRF